MSFDSGATVDGPNFLPPCKEHREIEVAFEDVHRADGALDIDADVLKNYVTADYKDGQFRLRARGVAGVFALNSRVVARVRPRFPIANLTHMVTVCGYEPTAVEVLRDYEIADVWPAWLVDVLTDSLLATIKQIGSRGMHRTYRRRTESSSFPHGRIDATATMLRRAARGTPYRSEYSWFERTVDNEPNRLVKAAVVALHRHYQNAAQRHGQRSRVGGLSTALHLFADVHYSDHEPGSTDRLIHWRGTLPTHRSYYRHALEVARAVLTQRGVSLDKPAGAVRLPSLLVKTDDLFESFVRLSLQRAFVDRSSPASILNGNLAEGSLALYDSLPESEVGQLPPGSVVLPPPSKTQTTQPDLVVRNPDGTYPLVADVKYTHVTGYADRDEVDQVVLYGVRYRSRLVMTIHPVRSGKSGLFVAGRIGEVTVLQYRVDLNSGDIDAEMDAMAVTLIRLIEASASETG